MTEPLHHPDLNRTVSAGRENAPEYLAYLQSPEWRTQRNRALQRAGYRCARCDSKRRLQVHHVSYERLGSEWDQDLEVLCDECHRGEHLAAPDQTSLGVYLKLASEAVKANPFADIADLSEAIKVQCVALGIVPTSSRIASALAVCGLRLSTRTPSLAPRHETREVPIRPLSHSQASELLCRLGVAVTGSSTSMGQLIRTMPAIERTAAEQRAHEDKLREQVAQFKRESGD